MCKSLKAGMSFPFGSKKGEQCDWDVEGAQSEEASFCKKSFIHASCIYLQLFYVEHTLAQVSPSRVSQKKPGRLGGSVG